MTPRCVVAANGKMLAVLLIQKLEVSFAAHDSGAEEVFDDEDRNRGVGGNNERAFYTRFNVDAVVWGLAVKAKSVLLEYANEVLIGNRTDGGHGLLVAHGETID